MEDIGNGIWHISHPLKVLGANLGARMTITNTASGLFLHSPTALDGPTHYHLKNLGEPAYIIAPNLFHHMFVTDYIEAFPNAKLYILEALSKRRPDLKNPIFIEEGQHYPWSEDLDHLVFYGGRWFQEVIFFHRKSQTLILTDFAFQLQDTGSRLVNALLKFCNCFETFGQTPLERLFIQDRKALRKVYENIMLWDFKRISITHGPCLENDAKNIFRNAIEKEL